MSTVSSARLSQALVVICAASPEARAAAEAAMAAVDPSSQGVPMAKVGGCAWLRTEHRASSQGTEDSSRAMFDGPGLLSCRLPPPPARPRPSPPQALLLHADLAVDDVSLRLCGSSQPFVGARRALLSGTVAVARQAAAPPQTQQARALAVRPPRWLPLWLLLLLPGQLLLRASVGCCAQLTRLPFLLHPSLPPCLPACSARCPWESTARWPSQ